MQSDLLQLFLKRTGSAFFALVLLSMPPAFADEAKALPGIASLLGLADVNTVDGLPDRWASWQNSPVFEFVPGRGNGNHRSGGLFFRTSEGLLIGARGNFNPGSGDMSAGFAFRLEF